MQSFFSSSSFTTNSITLLTFSKIPTVVLSPTHSRSAAAIGGAAIGSYIYKIKKNSPYRKQQAVIGGLAASLATGYVSYKISKKIKEKMDQ